VITVMYAGLCFSIAEMSPALPHTGGAYSFARSAMGPWAPTSPAWPRTWSTS
jgi:ethanolamine permease